MPQERLGIEQISGGWQVGEGILQILEEVMRRFVGTSRSDRIGVAWHAGVSRHSRIKSVWEIK